MNSPITAKVRPEDRAAILKLAGSLEVDPAILAGVAATVGSDMLLSSKITDALKEPKPPAFLLWQCIERDEKQFTESLPVALDEGMLNAHQEDAGKMRREFADWLGTLIMTGIPALESDEALAVHLAPLALETLCKAATYEITMERRVA